MFWSDPFGCVYLGISFHSYRLTKFRYKLNRANVLCVMEIRTQGRGMEGECESTELC